MEEETNQDVPIEEVNKVIEESNKDTSVVEGSKTPEGYKDLTEDEAKKELDEIIVPEKTEDTNQPIETVEQEAPKQEKININLLQFECSECNFKSYSNLEDNKANPLPEPIRCINCGKKKAIKKRIFNMTINDYKEIVRQEETVEEEVAKEE